VRLGPYAPTLDGGHAAAHELARSGCSAAIAFNDLMAIGALLSLQERGIDVPGQMSIIGSDNIDGSTYCRPALTTLHSLGETVGRQAVSTLIEVISGRAGSPVTMLPSELIVRSSTGPVSARARASMPVGAMPVSSPPVVSAVSAVSSVSALSG